MMDGILGSNDPSQESSIYNSESNGLNGGLFQYGNHNQFQSQLTTGLYNQNSLTDNFTVSVPNPKRANPIDFTGLNENFSFNSVRTPQSNHDRFGSSFSHLATESRSELSALGMNISRAKSSDAPTPDLSDSFHLNANSGWTQSRSGLGLSNADEIALDPLLQRGISPKPSTGNVLLSNFGLLDSNNLGLKNVNSEPSNLDSRAWPFVDKPPGLLSRATSSLATSNGNIASSSLFGGLTRPVSTPAYLNKNTDLTGLGLGLGTSISNSNNQSSFLLGGLNDSRGLKGESVSESQFSNLGSELSQLHNPFSGLALESTEESRWPKPVRYGRPMDGSENLLGSIMRPASSSGLSPLSNTDRLSISPKPVTGEKNIMESKILALSREHTPPPSNSRLSPKLSINTVDDRAIENVIATNCHHILLDAAEHSLKAVELANTLRARVGTEVLGIVRERWGGLLSLLERHPERFLVERIPKNDRVSLHSAKHAQDLQSPVGETFANELSLSEEKDSEIDAESQQASRCLHVGNVPSSYTEVQLMKEFEKFGQLDGLKLITQKNGNRRFAFVTFKTISQAITARHCLSKVHPWKSAISFAHRDFTVGNNSNNNSNHSNNSSSHNQYHHQSNNHPNASNNSNNNSHGSHHPHHGKMVNHHSHHQQQQHHPSQASQHQHQKMINGKRFQGPDYSDQHHHHGGNSHSLQHHPSPLSSLQNQQFPALSSASSQQKTAAMSLLSESSANLFSDALSGKYDSSSHSQQLRQNYPNSNGVSSHGHGAAASRPAGAAAGGGSMLIGTHPLIESFPDKHALQIILNRLCDDTYVPTQPWPIDAAADIPFCQAVTDQVSHFGGSTTISKLRGFLKHRVGTTDNIKSVPLKALLLAYPNLFKIEGNLVSLVASTSSAAAAL